jgi:hypothetical protein
MQKKCEILLSKVQSKVQDAKPPDAQITSQYSYHSPCLRKNQ